MKPPICEVCGEVSSVPGGLLRFAARPSDTEWHRRSAADPGFVGHPPDAAWFCERHLADATALTGETIDVVLHRLRATPAAASVDPVADADRNSLDIAPMPTPALAARIATRLIEQAEVVAERFGIALTDDRWGADTTTVNSAQPREPDSGARVVTTVMTNGAATLRHQTAWWNHDERARSELVLTLGDVSVLAHGRPLIDRVELASAREAGQEAFVRELFPG